jgi:hypothetical protein
MPKWIFKKISGDQQGLWEEFFVYIGIDLFVKILVFVKINEEEGQEI